MKYETFERPLNSYEISELQKKRDHFLQHAKWTVRKSFKCAAWASGVSALLSAPALLANTPPWLNIMVFFAGALGIWLAMEIMQLKERQRSHCASKKLEQGLRCSRVQVQCITSTRLIEIEEIEDEGACWYFEVSQDHLLELVGQDFYETDDFPSTCFEIIEVLNEDNDCIDWRLNPLGKKLKPTLLITAKDKLKPYLPIGEPIINCAFEDFQAYVNRMA